MPANSREYQKEYMREYNNNSPSEYCAVCCRNVKHINFTRHRRSKTHKILSKFIEGLKTI